MKCAIGEGLKIDKTCHTRPVFHRLALENQPLFGGDRWPASPIPQEEKRPKRACVTAPYRARVAQEAFVHPGNHGAMRETVVSQRTRSLGSTITT